MIDDKFIAEVEGILPLVYDDSLSYYEVLEKVTYLLNECIQKVNNVADPVIYTPTVNEDGTISWTNNGGLPNPEPVDISGPIGPAPSISVTDITGGHRITIVDEDHPDGINIDVMNGAKGEQGDAGVSPAITITDVLGGHRITITDAEHPQGQSFNVMNGDKGEQGDAGVSPTVTITDILGGHRITITDAAHPQGQNFDVMNGAKGDTGAGVPAGGTTGQILAKASNTDYDLGWINDINVKPPEIGIVITGARPSIAVTAGQYVIVRNSAISGITDGLYTANSALSPSTDVTAANLSAVNNGGLNSLKSTLDALGNPYFRSFSKPNVTCNGNSSAVIDISIGDVPSGWAATAVTSWIDTSGTTSAENYGQTFLLNEWSHIMQTGSGKTMHLMYSNLNSNQAKFTANMLVMYTRV